MFFWYKNSILATIVSIIGCAMIGFGVLEGVWVLAIIGLVFEVLAGKISDRKANKR